MQFFICRPLKKVSTARQCEKATGKPLEELPEPCKACNPEQAQQGWRKYSPQEMTGEALYQEFKAVWLEQER